MDDITIARFAALFAGRTDAYGTLDAAGGQAARRAPLTLREYRRHLVDGVSLGVFLVRDNGTASFGVTDIDTDDYEGAGRIAGYLLNHGADPWIERTKSKGYHVWTFHPPITRAAAIRRLHHDALIASGLPTSTEVFPKQLIVANGGLGNFINLPYVAKLDTRRVMVDERGYPVALDTFLDDVSVAPILESLSIERDSPPAKTFLPLAPSPGLRPACMQAIIDRSHEPGTFAGQRNDALIRLAAYEVGTAQDPAAWHTVYGAGTRMGLDDREIQHVFQMAERGYVYGCDRKREVAACMEACVWEACRFHPQTPTVNPLVVHNSSDMSLADDSEGEEEEEDDGQAQGPETAASRYDEETLVLRAGRGWTGDLAMYLHERQGTPLAYAWFAALTCAGHALGNRAWFRGPNEQDTFCHLWTLILGDSGVGKSSAVGPVLDFAHIPPGKRLWESGTFEAWMAALTDDPALFMYQDEIVTLLNGFRQRGMERAKPTFTSLYATGRGTVGHQTIGRGKNIVSDVALTILACSTLEWFQQHVTPEDFRGGLMARWLIAPLEETFTRGERPPRDPAVERELREQIVACQDLWGEIVFRPELRARIDDWSWGYRDALKHQPGEAQGLVQRLALFAMKAAAILHVTSAPANWQIVGEEAVERALTLLDWLAPRMVRLIATGLAGSDFERKCQRVAERLKRSKGRTMRFSDLRRAFGWETRTFNDVLQTLSDSRTIAVEEQRGGVGRPTKTVRYIRKGQS